MEKIKLGKGQVLHKKGEEIRRLEIVLSGALSMTDGDEVEVRLGSGAMAGAVHLPGETYAFDYVALEESTLATLEYGAEEDVVGAVTGTPAIAPAMASAGMELAGGMLDALTSVEEAAASLCKEIKYNYNDYRFLCAKLRMTPTVFPLVEALDVPAPSALSSGWEADAVRAFCEQKETLKKGFYSLDVSFCVDTVMRASEIGRRIRKDIEAATNFIRQTKEWTEDFTKTFYDVRSRVDTEERGASDDTPAISDALDVILAFSGVKSEVAEAFRKAGRTFSLHIYPNAAHGMALGNDVTAFGHPELWSSPQLASWLPAAVRWADELPVSRADPES